MNISIDDFLELDNVEIIDMRSIEKYNDYHIPSAKHIPKLLLLKDPEKYLNRNSVYYIYCQNGANSYKVCCALEKKGYKVRNILGGYESWVLKKS